MSDEDHTEAQPVPPDPKMAAFFALHTLLGVIGSILTLGAVSGILPEGKWRVFVGGCGTLISGGAIALAKGWMSPRQRAIMAHYSPTPTAVKPPGPPSLPLAVLLPLLLVPALLLAACAHGKAIGIDIGKCALGQVPTVVSHIVPDVSDILGGDSPNWQKDLTNLGISAGVNTVTCAVASLIEELTKKTSSLDPMGRRMLQRGQIWLTQHGVE